MIALSGLYKSQISTKSFIIESKSCPVNACMRVSVHACMPDLSIAGSFYFEAWFGWVPLAEVFNGRSAPPAAIHTPCMLGWTAHREFVARGVMRRFYMIRKTSPVNRFVLIWLRLLDISTYHLSSLLFLCIVTFITLCCSNFCTSNITVRNILPQGNRPFLVMLKVISTVGTGFLMNCENAFVVLQGC